MVLVLSEINCTLLKERLKSGQNCTENQPLGTLEGLISRTRLKKSSWTWNFGILRKSTWRLCVPILSEIGWPSFPSLPRSLRQKLLISFWVFSEYTIFVPLRVTCHLDYFLSLMLFCLVTLPVRTFLGLAYNNVISSQRFLRVANKIIESKIIIFG